ncbi:MAG: cation-translocating P-type ATPase [Verrucomicrobiota bacterium]
MKTSKLQITGMTCAGCASTAQKALAAVPGVESVTVNFISKTATITGGDEAELIAAVKAAGYTAQLPSRNREAEEVREARLHLLRTAGIGVILLCGAVFHLTPLAIAATILAGFPIVYKAIKALLAKRLDADVLVAIAVIAASSVGEFVAAGEVAFIMQLGEQLEAYTTRRARRSLGSLLSLIPAMAHIRRDDEESEIPSSELQVGDIVVVRAGERIPVDGVVLSGTASVNQAPVTGESMPVTKEAGAEVFVGTLNETGALIIEAQRVGEETTLARIAQLVEAAQQREAPIQRTLDRLAGYLVPVMLTLAALVYLFSHDIHRAIIVLIVACPCALILATPTAVMAGIARAARAGVLIKGGQYLEATARLHTIVFDKTGTLTYGQPEVTHTHSFDDHGEIRLVAMAAIAEKLSSHPIARAIVRKAGGRPVDPSRFTSHQRGVVAEHNGQTLVVGRHELLTEQSISLTDHHRAHLDEHHDAGHTTVIVAHDGKVCGTICVADTVRADAGEAVANLRQLGIQKIVMLTGDNRRVALDIAGKLGIDEVQAEVLPEQKAQHIEALKKFGTVAMVGDGINDAPALAVADVGMAMGVTGTDVAHEAADVALMADDLSKIAFSVGLSRHALQIIKQGLWFALLYNVTMVTLAGSGHMNMIGGAIAHQFSSVLVILNAMRLLRYR